MHLTVFRSGTKSKQSASKHSAKDEVVILTSEKNRKELPSEKQSQAVSTPSEMKEKGDLADQPSERQEPSVRQKTAEKESETTSQLGQEVPLETNSRRDERPSNLSQG